MGKMTIGNLLGGDIFITSICNICGEEHAYRLKEKRICSKDKCYDESKKRSARNGYTRKSQ